MRLGKIFKNEKPLEHFEPRGHTLTYVLIWRGGEGRVRGGLVGRERSRETSSAAIAVIQAQEAGLGPDWKCQRW